MMFGRFIDDEKMYDWDSAYISQVLHSPVYAGHIIYEAKPTVSMKSKKRRYIPFENVSPGEVPLIRPHKVLHTGLRFLRFVLYTASNPVCAAPGQRTPGGASDLQSSSQGLPYCSQRPLRVPECPQRQLHAEHGLPNCESHRLSHHISESAATIKGLIQNTVAFAPVLNLD